MSNKSKLIVFVAVLASLLEIIDTSIVNVALSTMMGNLGATLEDISMVITGYAIANAVVLPVSGWLSEKIGRRTFYLGCIAAFTVTSVACGFAPNLGVLIVFRILQGAFGGALLPTSQALIYEQFPREKAGIAGAIFGMSVMIGPTLGPVLGGYLTDNLGWRSIFNVNLPLGILALVVGSACIFNREKSTAEIEQSKNSKIDAVGLGLLIAGIGCLQFVLERGEANDWFSSKAICTNAAIAAIALPSFVFWELRVKNPIINVRLFKEPIVTCGVLLMGFLGFFLYGIVFLLPVFVARVFHYTATQTGVLFIPGSLLTAFLMPFVGRSMAKVNTKFLIAIGLVGIEVCLLMMTHFSTLTSQHQIFLSLLARGVGMAFLFVPINSSILSQFTGAALGQVSGLLNLFRQIGGSMGIAMIATLMSSKAAQNYTNMISKLTMLDGQARAFMYQSMRGMSAAMTNNVGMGDARHAALMALFFRVDNQVFMITFLQVIFIIMLITGFSFVPLWFLKFKRKPVVVSDAH